MGSPILGYRVKIRGIDSKDYNYNQDLCQDYDNPDMIATSSCKVPIYILMDWPFSLPWGSSIIASLSAYNSYGDSDISQTGNGAVITTFPDAPYDLEDI